MATVEVILVDDGSSSPLKEFLAPRLLEKKIPCTLKIIRIDRALEGLFDTTFRAGLARNAGVIHSQGAQLLFLDSDILIPSLHLQELEKAFETADVVQNVRHMLKDKSSGPQTSVNRLDLQKDVYPEDYYWEKFKKTSDWNRLSAPWKYVCTYSMALRRKTFDEIRPFRPEFCEYGFEDTELGFRLYKAGLRFHLSKRPVFHLYPRVSEQARLHDSWSVHFDERTRFQTISRTAALFYRMHRDPSIFFELRSLLDPPSAV